MEERRLYCAVILQAIDDAVNIRVSTNGKHNGSVPLPDQQAARKWLTSPSRDLQDVCEAADVSMSMVLTFGRAQRQTVGWYDDFNYDAPTHLVVYERDGEPEFTGILNQHGDPLYRVCERQAMGFHHGRQPK